MSRNNLDDEYTALINYGTLISTLYNFYFVGDVCELERYSDDQANRCKSFLNSKL